MTTILQYRYFENEALIGEGQLQAIDTPAPELFPEIGHEFLLYPPAEGSARILAIGHEVKTQLGETDETHIMTIKIERI
jgi:hypothetical protein